MKILRKLFFICALGLLLYGLAVYAVIGGGHWFNFVGIWGSAALAALGLLLPLLWKKPAVRFVFLSLAAAFALCFAACMGQMVYMAGSSPADDAQWVIVLGAKVNSSGPSLEYGRRLQLCADYAKAHPSCMVMTTGGKGKNEPVSEAEAGKAMLMRLGVEEARIVCEDRSTSTEENLQNAAALFRQREGGCDASVVIVSSGFHLLRARQQAKAAGFTRVSSAGSRGLRILLPYYYLREFCALAYGLL